MSCGPLPPVPGLIPISALRKSPSCNNNDLRECTPCAAQKEVMGEQRSRRPGSQPNVDLIDIARRSRGRSAAPQAPSASGKTTHRKSDRRRERRGGRKRSASKRREPSPEEKCVNPRVNPIFVWVRQEDTHIVDVKCEDYDKRNRIVLTKTAQGWRAIPRTETLVPNLRAAAPDDDDAKHQHQRKARKGGKVKRKSTAVQVDDDDVLQRMDVDDTDPAWSEPVNIESHLPSHTVHRKRSPSPANVNTSADHDYTAQASAVECSVSKVCDVTVSPLDNLLAVAELEFNQQIQTEAWCEAEGLKTCEPKDFDVSIELISKTEATLHDLSSITQSDNFDSDGEKDEDCDYNEEDENNLAMDDILTRLEQSLQSPDALCTDIAESIMGTVTEEDPKPDATEVPDDSLATYQCDEYMEKEEEVDVKPDSKVGSSTITESEADTPTDLSTSKKIVECLTITLPDDDLMPTDLSVPKKTRSPSPRPVSPRPSSRCSETIQSPQPSGLPAVPHSPDVQTTKSAYLESLLSSTKISLNSEVTITVKEPLDFGKCRKSASPTVTCSEEVNTCSSSTSKDGEPETKKGRLDDITLRTILDANIANSNEPGKEDNGKNRNGKSTAPETSRLLELLTSESEPDALTQLKQLYSDANVNLPDPMLIPKDRLSQILMSPGKDIPRLLAQRPELRLPEALAFPHLLQDPDILVITLAQLETIIRKQTGLPLPVEKPKSNSSKKTSESEGSVKSNDKAHSNSKPQREHAKQGQGQGQAASKDSARMNELCNDINLASNNALNQMMWLPYLHQLEVAAMAFGNGADFLKMLSSAFPPYSNQLPDVAQMFPLNRFPQPPGFPNMQPLQNNNFNNPFEFPIWHENAAATANLPQRSAANQFERHCNKNAYREYKSHQSSSHKYPSASKQPPFPPTAMFQQNNPSMHGMPPFVNVPAAYQQNMRPNLQIPQFSSILTQKNPLYSKSNGKTSPTLTTPHRSNQRYSYNQKLGSLASSHKAKAPFNPLEGLQKSLAQEGFKKSADFATQPMDLSGSGATAGKSRLGKQNFCDSVNLAKSLKFDDVPEVGSTTASIEDMTAHMQDSQKHLWHPLFGKIHVKRIIGVLRQKNTVLHEMMPMFLAKKKTDDVAVVDQILTVSCALVNVCPPIIV